MRDVISIIIFIALIVIFAMTFAPLIILVLLAGIIYTIYTRYKIAQAIKRETKEEEALDSIETPQQNLEIIEAEYEEKSR